MYFGIVVVVIVVIAVAVAAVAVAVAVAVVVAAVAVVVVVTVTVAAVVVTVAVAFVTVTVAVAAVVAVVAFPVPSLLLFLVCFCCFLCHYPLLTTRLRYNFVNPFSQSVKILNLKHLTVFASNLKQHFVSYLEFLSNPNCHHLHSFCLKHQTKTEKQFRSTSLWPL